MEIKPVAYYRGPLSEKFGVPRQAGLVPDLPGAVEFCDGFDPDSLDGLDGFDYIWLIWGFSLNNPDAACSAKVRPPRLGGNEKKGVYATRSPYRPNPLGLSSVRISGIDAAAGRISVLGADLVDGTPIYDIKPYVEYADAHCGIRSGFADSTPGSLIVQFPEGQSLKDLSTLGQGQGVGPVDSELSPCDDEDGNGRGRSEDGKAGRTEFLEGMSFREREVLKEILSQDPRPAYHDDPQRVYGLTYKGKNVRFRVEGDVLTVLGID